MDRQLYKQEIQRLLAEVKGLEIVDGAVTNVLLLKGTTGEASYRAPAQSSIAGVLLASGRYSSSIACAGQHSCMIIMCQ